MEKTSEIICSDCLHKKVDFKQQLYCEKVNKIPDELLSGIKQQCSCFEKKEKKKVKIRQSYFALLVLISFMLAFGSSNSIFASAKEKSPELEQSQLTLAVGGKTGKIKVVNGTIKDCTSLDTGIVKVTGKGVVTPKKEGTAAILVSVLGQDQAYTALYCEVTVINPTLSDTDVILNGQEELSYYLKINGLIGSILDEKVTCASSNPDIVSVKQKENGIYLYGESEGTADVSITIYGKKLTCHVTVINFALDSQAITLEKGKSKTIKFSNQSKTITWKSSDKSIASVNSSGKITAKNFGNATITGKSGKDTYTCYVAVASSEAIKAVKKAEASVGALYSQAKRMEEGYYDCSSLTWRSYSPYGVCMGSENWAPTAADQGKWCVENGKIIAEKGVSVEELVLLPGDLIFYAKSQNNGRYKNIYHVAMFTGYQIEKTANGDSELKGYLVDANGKTVAKSQYRTEFSFDKGIVLIGRPAKMD